MFDKVVTGQGLDKVNHDDFDVSAQRAHLKAELLSGGARSIAVGFFGPGG
jgi:hypothetical protein